MSIRRSRMLLTVFVTGLLCMAPARLAAQAAQPQYQNEQEYKLYDAMLKDTNPKTKLEKLQEWEKQFPTTNFTKERKALYLQTYIALNQPKEAAAAAKNVLADNPKDFTALYYSMLLTRSLYTGSETGVLDDGEKASQALLADIATPPAGVTPDQWAKLRPDIENLAHFTIGFVNLQKKNWDGAEAELKKALEVKPENGETDYLLYIVMAGKKSNSAALYYLARAASFSDPQLRATRQGELQKAFTIYVGNTDGLNDLMAAAKAAPNPPADFHIKSKAEALKEKYAADAAGAEKFAKEHPDLALWKNIKETLGGSGGADYFNQSMKEAKVPTLRGKVVKLEPAVKPKIIYMAMDDGAQTDASTADATLKFETPLPGKVEPGAELTFEGVGESYTANPLMVVFNVDKNDLHGWTGKNTPTAPVRHPAAGKKK